MTQLADDTIAELEAMKSENIHLSSETVKYDGELQAAKQALQQLTAALEVIHSQSELRCFCHAHLSRMCLWQHVPCHPCSIYRASGKTDAVSPLQQL